MKLLFLHAWRRWYVLLAGLLLFGVTFGFQADLNLYSLVTIAESTCFFVFAVLGAFVLSNSDEVELCKCYGLRLSSLLTAQILPLFSCALVGSIPVMCFYEIEGLTAGMRLQLCASAVVTLAFWLCISVFVRVLIRNTYAVIGFLMILYWPVTSFHNACKEASVPPELFVLDPFLSALMFQEKYGPVPQETWLINRILFLAVAAALYAVACLMINSKRFEDLK
ncbi:MAG: hypothetical protein IJX64_05545 [Clostridia bacterium]|nr:hypothetical protein [Clostridia bacterium]